MKRVNIMLISFVLLLIIFNIGSKNVNPKFIYPPKSEEELQAELKVNLEYLESNHSKIDLGKMGFSDLELLESDLQGKEIFFTGEIHGIKPNSELNWKFLKYLKERTNFKYYLIEHPYSNAYFLNKYLESGDIKILENIYRPLKGTYAWNKDGYDHWKRLYEYNNTLPKEDKIHIVGVDIEHQAINGYRYLVEILPKEEVPQDIKEMIDKVISTFNSLEENGYGPTLQTSKELDKDIEDKEKIYREYLGADFFGFKHVNSNILKADEAYKHRRNQIFWNNTRDKMIYDNFQTIERRLPKGNFYGQWGINHIFQSPEKDILWFGTHLNSKDSKFKDKILSIAYNYDNCEQMNKYGDRNYVVGEMTFIYPPFKEVNDLIGGNLNIYRLTGENTIFSEIPMYNSFTGLELEENMLDFFQYIIVIKDFGPTDPLYDNYD